MKLDGCIGNICAQTLIQLATDTVSFCVNGSNRQLYWTIHDDMTLQGFVLQKQVLPDAACTIITETFDSNIQNPAGWYGDGVEVVDNVCADNTSQLHVQSGTIGFKLLPTQLNHHYRVRYKLCSNSTGNIEYISIKQWPTDLFDLDNTGSWPDKVQSNPSDFIDGIQINNTQNNAWVSFDFTAVDVNTIITLRAGNELFIDTFTVEDLTMTAQFAAKKTLYRYRYNGKEISPEVGSSVYDYTARLLNSGLGRWMSVDPLAGSFPWQSPFSSMDNSPILKNDPTGQSGEVTINKQSQSITVSQHFVFYGGKAKTNLSNKIATGIASQWNGAHGKVVVDGVKYNVNFKVTYKTVSEAVATKMALVNTDIKNNFIRVEDGVGSSKFHVGGNSGYFNTADDIGGSTTPAHEIGHGLGLRHSSTGGQTRKDVPDIMEPRGTEVNPRWSKAGKSNDIDPNFRRVSGDEVNSIFKGVTYDKSGKGKIGTTTNKIFTKDGK